MTEKCSNCKTGKIYYSAFGDGIDYEFWDCDNCNSEFYVPIEITRDFANMQNQTHGDEKKVRANA